MDINAELLYGHDEWYKANIIPTLMKERGDILSTPFCFALSEEYIMAPRKIMIIGQETDSLCDWSEYNGLEAQNRSIQYFKKQLFNDEKNNCSFNRSAFWKYIRRCRDFGYMPCWNNVDSIMRIVDEKNTPLSLELEKEFQKPVSSLHMTLLNYQISLSKPNIIIFVTGPYYRKTMEWGMEIDEGSLDNFHPVKDTIIDITDVCVSLKQKGITVLWSYHPNFINFCGKSVWDRMFDSLNVYLK